MTLLQKCPSRYYCLLVVPSTTNEFKTTGNLLENLLNLLHLPAMRKNTNQFANPTSLILRQTPIMAALVNSDPTGTSKRNTPNRCLFYNIISSWVYIGSIDLWDNPNTLLRANIHGILWSCTNHPIYFIFNRQISILSKILAVMRSFNGWLCLERLLGNAVTEIKSELHIPGGHYAKYQQTNL